MIFKILMASLLVATQTFDAPYLLYILFTVIMFFSLIYYHMIFTLATGLSQAMIVTDTEELRDSFLSVVMHWCAFFVIFMSEYQLYSIFLLPWLILSAISIVFAFLVKIGFLEIHDRDDEDDEL